MNNPNNPLEIIDVNSTPKYNGLISLFTLLADLNINGAYEQLGFVITEWSHEFSECGGCGEVGFHCRCDDDHSDFNIGEYEPNELSDNYLGETTSEISVPTNET